MRPSALLGLLPLLSQTFALLVPYRDAEQEGTTNNAVRNANHIFNAIHSSMRQWGSSWNHNGMSYFLATVPEDTEFYYGSHTADPATGTDWLAFEPEHALWFVGMEPYGGPPGGPCREHPPGQPEKEPPSHHACHGTLNQPCNAQNPIRLNEDHPSRPCRPPPRGPAFGGNSPGHLHIYRTKHPLSLLYLDGMSAAKSSMGTLDSQDFGLLGWNRTVDRMANAPQDEQARAQEMCALATDRWNHKIDGFIRMEIGFEMILCDVEKHLEEIDTLTTEDLRHQPRDRPEYNQLFEWYRAIAARFDGIGYNRVTLNYDAFVTAYAFDLDIFPATNNNSNPNSTSLPRLNTLSTSDLAPLRSALDTLVLSHDQLQQCPTTIDWQAIADLIITRYSSAIPYFAAITDLSTLQAEIQLLSRPFIDFSARNLTAETDRCTRHFLPRSSTHDFDSSIAATAITTVSHRICHTLLSTLYISPTASTLSIQKPLQDLVQYLDWTSWRRCPRLCHYDEVCFIPIWPLGTVADRERGMGVCVNATELVRDHGMGVGKERSYWGFPVRP